MGEGIDSQAYQHLEKKTTLEIEKLRTEFILFKQETKESDVKNEKFFDELNEKLVKFKVEFDENLQFIDKKMKLMAVPNGENVTYSYIQKSLQTYRDVFDDRLDLMDRKFDDIKAHLASV